MQNEFIVNFLDWLKIGHSPETVSSYHWALRIFSCWLSGEKKEIFELSQKDFVNYVLYLREDRKVAMSTQETYVTALRSLWDYLYRQKIVSLDKSIIPLPHKDREKHYESATSHEVELLKNSYSELIPQELRNKTIISFLADTGSRLGEMLSIKVGDLNLEGKKAVIKTKKRKNHYREIYWKDETTRLLKKWLEVREEIMERADQPTDSLWINLSTQGLGHPAKRCIIERVFRNRRKKVGIDRKITPHSLRHHFTHNALDKQVHPRFMQLMLGHAKLDTTMHYMGVAKEEVEKIYREKIAA